MVLFRFLFAPVLLAIAVLTASPDPARATPPRAGSADTPGASRAAARHVAPAVGRARPAPVR